MAVDKDEQLEWEEPGPDRRAKWVRRLEPVMEHPGKWARVFSYDNQQSAINTAVRFRRGGLRTPPGRWEIVNRTVDGRGYIYARYLGPDEPESEPGPWS